MESRLCLAETHIFELKTDRLFRAGFLTWSDGNKLRPSSSVGSTKNNFNMIKRPQMNFE